MYRVEVRRCANDELLSDEGRQEQTDLALRTATQLLHRAGACLFQARNESVGKGRPSIRVYDETLPFYVRILNSSLVDAEGCALADGESIGPFPTSGTHASA